MTSRRRMERLRYWITLYRLRLPSSDQSGSIVLNHPQCPGCIPSIHSPDPKQNHWFQCNQSFCTALEKMDMSGSMVVEKDLNNNPFAGSTAGIVMIAPRTTVTARRMPKPHSPICNEFQLG